MTLRNPLNRRMRTRMSGGVAGESGQPLPLCRFIPALEHPALLHATSFRYTSIENYRLLSGDPKMRRALFVILFCTSLLTTIVLVAQQIPPDELQWGAGPY